MSLLSLLLLIILIGVCLQYVPLPSPVPAILRVVAIILAVVLLIVVLQALGVLPAFLNTPARIRFAQ